MNALTRAQHKLARPTVTNSLSLSLVGITCQESDAALRFFEGGGENCLGWDDGGDDWVKRIRSGDDYKGEGRDRKQS